MIGIIGSGASGMAAAIAAARLGARVTLLERGPRVGRKLAATGNGRCNITNMLAAPGHYVSDSPETLAAMLANNSPGGVRAFFDALGLPTVEEDEGRVYPSCNLAGGVVDAMRLALAELEVDLRVDCAVKAVRREGKGFAVALDSGESLKFDRLIVAAGGKAAEKNGGTDDGVRMLRALGHSVLPTSPALSPLCTETERIRPLKGIRAACALSAEQNGKPLRRERGEILFTEFGISGIAAMQLSTGIARASGAVTIFVDFFPDRPADELREYLARRQESFPNRPLPEWLAGLLHRRIAEVLFKFCDLGLNALSGELIERDLARLAAAMKQFPLRCTGVRPLAFAQATAGGAALSEFDPKTMESRQIPGLFAAGEVLDAVGDCGGFNLHWAWVTGLAAGRAAAQNE